MSAAHCFGGMKPGNQSNTFRGGGGYFYFYQYLHWRDVVERMAQQA